jgi:hypothetical protein
MEDPFFLMVYALGFVGLAAISLIPLRSWLLLRRFLSHHSRAAALLVGALAGVTLIFEARIVFRVFHCLMGEYCGASGAQGWILLAMLGAAYLAFESAVGLVFVAVRFASRRAA